ncbi:MAG TPA: aminotransferase class V-fold PLP-dependent enzyme [Phycisphaerae bacterium]|nr:aminotransferase class V-fold PLP-dependent enzyme [Phycisphaerae bacterium]
MANEKNKLAINGGEKAVPGYEGINHPKIGIEEFMELVDTWGYSVNVKNEIRRLVETERDIPEPHLARYYHPKQSKVALLEEYAKNFFGTKHALAVNSGTSALIAAYIGAGIGPGDEVIVPGYTFFATVSAVVVARAIPVIAEIDETMTLDPEDVERKITPQTKAIVPVHIAGHACNMDAIMEIARKHNIKVIEDTAQACGGMYKGRRLGSIGDAGCFSLSTWKITGAGEGGMVITNDDMTYIKAQGQHDTAACWRPDRFGKERMPGELFCGENYRMSELEGSVIYVQMQKSGAQFERYNTNMRRIASQIGKYDRIKLRPSNDINGDVGYILTLLPQTPGAATELATALAAEGVPAGARGTKVSRDWHVYAFWEQILQQKTATPEGCPFTCPLYKGMLPKYSQDMCPRTMDIFDRAVNIAVNQWWTPRDCDNIAAAINKVCRVLG